MDAPLSPLRLGTTELGDVQAAITAMPPAPDDRERIDRIRHFEELKSAIAAAQAAETAAFVVSQRARQAADGVPADRQDRGIASQIALARRTSLHAAQRYAGWSSILVRELPETLAALRAGRTSEWRATLLARETMFLSREGRSIVDAELGCRLETMSDRAVEVETRKAAYRLDPQGSLARSKRAVADRCVSIRPAPETMVRVSGLLPVTQGVACFAALSHHADTLRSDGDARSRGQVMADTFVERLTGQAKAADVPIEIELVVGTDTLLGARKPRADLDTGVGAAFADDAASADDAGLFVASGLTPMPVPAGLARDLVAEATQVRVRRLFRCPDSGELVAMETRSRLFTEGQKRFIRFRDEYCATPWCGAPIRHADHVVPAAEGGRTRLDNGRGLCQACNHAMQARGWRSRIRSDGAIVISTPTGHTYLRPPPDRGDPPSGATPATRVGIPSRTSATGARASRGSCGRRTQRRPGGSGLRR